MTLPGINIIIGQSNASGGASSVPQDIFSILTVEESIFSFIIRAVAGASILIHWDDETVEGILFTGEYQTITKTFAAGDFIVRFEGDISTISFISVNQMPILTG